jgi:UDP-N-acetylmuramoyl-tripeptide--D-alanyl-D-alanine ligase
VSYINNLTVHDRKYGGSRAATAILLDTIMANMTTAQLQSCTGGTLVCGKRVAAFSSISIDTRSLNPGDLFFAIRGPKDDGHKHIPAALGKGAVGAVVESDYDPAGFPADRLLLKVGNTHRALKDIAREVRRAWRGSLIAITGSMGKTTTKEFAAHVLQTEFSVYRSPGNYNNLFGLPLALFALSSDDHIGIFEMGMSARGEIAEMCRIATPDIGIITNIAPVHLTFFSSVDEIAQAKGELAGGLPPGGTLVYNADDPRVREIAAKFGGPKISFGLSAAADVRADEIETVGLQETRFRLSCFGFSRRAAVPLLGTHYLMNALPAAALAHHYRIDLDQIVESLRHLSQAPMRGQILRFREGFTVIDDSYNSNPQALMRMVETVAGISPCKRRILVAGEMLELGKDADALHYSCGSWAAKHGFDMVVAVQGSAKELARGAVEGGVPESQVHFFTEVNPANDFVTRDIRPGDVVLIKGSRGVRLEKVVQALRSYFGELPD